MTTTTYPRSLSALCPFLVISFLVIGLAGCGRGPVFDPTPLSNYVVITINNDTNGTVTVASVTTNDVATARRRTELRVMTSSKTQ